MDTSVKLEGSVNIIVINGNCGDGLGLGIERLRKNQEDTTWKIQHIQLLEYVPQHGTYSSSDGSGEIERKGEG